MSADHVAVPPEVFLDTSIFVAELKGNVLKPKIEAAIGRFQLTGSSTYVMLEYARVVLKELKYYVNCLNGGMSLQKLCYRVNNQLPRQYHTKKVAVLFNLVMEHFEEPEAAERATLAIKERLHVGTDAIRSRCDHVVNGIKCRWAEQCGAWRPPKLCDKPPLCRLPEFFEENKELFIRIRDACRCVSSDKTGQLRGFATVIDDAVSDSSGLRDPKTCRKLADAIIAVQSAKFRAFFTQNFSDSRVLCQVLEQLLLELHQSPDDEVEYRDYRLPTGGSTRNDA